MILAKQIKPEEGDNTPPHPLRRNPWYKKCTRKRFSSVLLKRIPCTHKAESMLTLDGLHVNLMQSGSMY